MFAQLGDHIFQGLKTPQSLNESDAVKYGQIPIINGKPVIQPTGAELREISLTILYSVDFCDPTTEIDALKKSMHDFEVLPFITGEGRIIGKFVIKNIDTTTQRTADDGRLEMASINMNLMESPGGPDPEPVGEAVTSEDPVTEPPAEPVPSPATEITKDISAAQSKVNAIKKAVANVKGKVDTFKRCVNDVRQLANDAQQLYTSAKTKVENAKKIIERAKQLPTSLSGVIKYAENLAKMDNVIDASVLEMNVNQLSQSAEKVTAHAAPLAGFMGTKEGGK